MPCSYRVQVWRRDHWMTIWRGLSYPKARQIAAALEIDHATRIAIP